MSKSYIFLILGVALYLIEACQTNTGGRGTWLNECLLGPYCHDSLICYQGVCHRLEDIPISHDGGNPVDGGSLKDGGIEDGGLCSITTTPPIGVWTSSFQFDGGHCHCTQNNLNCNMIYIGRADGINGNTVEMSFTKTNGGGGLR